MLKRRILASSMASVMALTSIASVAFADAADTTYATRKQLQDYVAEMEKFADTQLNNYGQISVEKFENVLTYASGVASDSATSNDEVAVAYMMLVEAHDRLVIHSYEELQALLKDCKPDYDTENILNEDVGGQVDNIWTEPSYGEFEDAYDTASNVGPDDAQLITDCYEDLYAAWKGLTKLDSVTKRELSKTLGDLDKLLLNEFKYNGWTRGKVTGSGTAYDDKEFAWGILFYHVAGAREDIADAYEMVLAYKSINVTTNETVVAAYKNCVKAINVLSGFKANSMKSYSQESAVTNLITNKYKDAIVCSDVFVPAAKAVCDSDLLTINEVDLSKIKASDITAAYSKGKLTAVVNNSKGLKIDGGKFVTATGDDDKEFDNGAKINLLQADIASKIGLGDLVAILAANLSAVDETDPATTGYNNGVWDGISATGGDSDDEDSAFTGTIDSKVALDAKDAAKGYNSGTKIYNSDKATIPYASVQLALEILLDGTSENGGVTNTDIKDTSSTYAGKSAEERAAALITGDAGAGSNIGIAYSDNLNKVTTDKASRTEWNVIGQYLDIALGDIFKTEEQSNNNTKGQLVTLIKSCDTIIDETADSYVFAARQAELEDCIKAAVETANTYRKDSDKLDDTDQTVYNDLKTSKEKLEAELAAFKYSFAEISQYVAKVGISVATKGSAVEGNKTLAAKAREVAYLLSEIEDLNLKDGSTLDDLAVDGDIFNGFNRVYTADGETDILTDNGDAVISDADNNPTHKALKKAYEDLIAAYESAVSGESGLLGDANNDGSFDVKDVTTVLVAIANGEENKLPAVADFNKDGTVNVKDVTDMLVALAKA